MSVITRKMINTPDIFGVKSDASEPQKRKRSLSTPRGAAAIHPQVRYAANDVNQNKPKQTPHAPKRALRFGTVDSTLAVLRTGAAAAAAPVVLLAGGCLVDLAAVAPRGRWPVTAAPAPAALPVPERR